MRIALVSKTNGCVGGASFFAENLAAWLVEDGHEVTHFCVEPRRELRPYQQAIPCRGVVSRALRHLNWRARRCGMAEPIPWEYWRCLKPVVGNFDVVHFHDLYMSISHRNLIAVSGRRPVVFTLHDCSAFTGGCLNPLKCERFRDECGGCPQARELGHFDFTRSNLKQFRRMAAESDIHYVFPSRWIKAEAARSLQFRSATTHIPNGFDPRSYRIQSREEARRILGLPQRQRIVVVSSASLDNKLKGVKFALTALRANLDLDPLVVLVGSPSSGLEKELNGMKFLSPGFIESRERLGLFFAAADLLLYPSLGDNLPITIQEAMAAGTPVLAFAVGGVPELVRHGENGWLVPVGDQAALNRQLREALQPAPDDGFGPRASEWIAREYSVAGCVSRHVELYRRLIQNFTPARNEC